MLFLVFGGRKNVIGAFLNCLEMALCSNLNSDNGMFLDLKARINESEKLTIKLKKPINPIPKIHQK